MSLFDKIYWLCVLCGMLGGVIQIIHRECGQWWGLGLTAVVVIFIMFVCHKIDKRYGD